MHLVASWTGGKADALRQSFRMSNEAFANHLGISVRTVANWRKRPEIIPQPSMQEVLDAALCAASEGTKTRFEWILSKRERGSGEGVSPWEIPGTVAFEGVSPDDMERLILASGKPARIDSAVVDSLATILAVQRRLDDTLGPAVILRATSEQANAVTELLRDTRGAMREALAPVAAEWVQFDAWLHAELGVHQAAARLLTQAEEMADDAGDGVLAAQAANFMGYVSRQQGQPRGIVRHFLSAYHTPGAHAAQRLGDAVQAAHGYALLGETADAKRLLREAEALESEADCRLPPGTAYWLTPDFQRMNIGLALIALSENAAAAEHIAAGLSSLPPDQRDAVWANEYREALAEAQAQV